MDILKKGFFVALSIFMGTAFSQNAQNPILFTDVPDPDVIRVGDTYYMSSTTMQYNPGLPIMKSTDLANWELVNYCYNILDNNNALNLNNGQEAYSGGTWASSINYHEGRYYVSSFSYTTNRTYIYHTADIENGPWTKITINRVFHDHTLFFDDDGRVYMAYGHDDIQLTELRPDLTGVLPGGFDGVIIDNASSVAGNDFILTAEGTRLQKINGTYYVSNICWPRGAGRTQILHRSSSLTGNYEGRVVFQSSNGSAQGEYTQTPDGQWYAMFFHDHGALGRIPDLMPVTWNNGWPTVGVNGQVPATVNIPGDNSLEGIITSDDFNYTGKLPLQWQWNHNPQNNYWSLSQREGYLRLTTDRIDPNVQMTRNTLTQRTYGPECTGYVELDVSGMKNGDYAGLIALQNDYGFVGVNMNNNSKSIVMAKGSGWEDNHTVIENVPLNQNTVYLRIDFDYTNRVDDAFFYYSLDGNSWQQIGNKLDTRFLLDHFVGYRFGLFSYATQSTGGYVDFNFFRVADDINATPIYDRSVEVSLISPASDQTVEVPADVYIEAEVSDPDAINTLQFFVNGEQVGATEYLAPYFTTYSVTAPGEYEITAVINLPDGSQQVSDPIIVTANLPQGPFGGTPWPIPGTIQAENYDVGGQDFAFNDSDADNQGNSDYRDGDGVDVETTGDSEGDYNVGYILNGEWLEYTVNVAEAGLYDIDLRMARDGDNGMLHIEMDGKDVTGTINVPNTGGWQTWETMTVNDIELEAGKQVMRIAFESDYMNLNYVTFTQVILDTDNDGTPDDEDGCPNDPDKIAPGICGCNLIDSDADGDGIYDCNDEHPFDFDNDGTNTADDCDDNNPDVSLAYTWYADTDADGVGVATNALESCTQPPGYVETFGDECPNDENKALPGDCGCGATEESCLDCNGVPNGNAYLDNCENCVGGNTSLTPCTQDCNGEWGGTAEEDACGTCAGGETGLDPVTDPQDCIATGIDEGYLYDVKVYPNPTTGVLHLSESSHWEIFNTQGEQVLKGQSAEVDLSALSKGVYLLKMDNKVVKVVKE